MVIENSTLFTAGLSILVATFGYVGFVHKDGRGAELRITDKLDKLTKIITDALLKSERHEAKLAEHEKLHEENRKKHEEHIAAINDLKKNFHEQNIRITKIEDKI